MSDVQSTYKRVLNEDLDKTEKLIKETEKAIFDDEVTDSQGIEKDLDLPEGSITKNKEPSGN